MILQNDKLLKQLLEKEDLARVSNESYIKYLSLIGKIDEVKVKEVLDSYGDQKWWLSNEIKTRAFGQLFEPTLVIPLEEMHNGISEILERPVFNNEFELTLGRLKTQVMQVIAEELEESSER